MKEKPGSWNENVYGVEPVWREKESKKKATIRKDAIGLYTFVGGWVVRPVGNKTRYKENDRVDVRHAYHVAKIGKDATCGHGEYLEEWVSYSVTKDDYLQGNDNPIEAKRITESEE